MPLPVDEHHGQVHIVGGASACSVTAHSVWANSACSSRSKCSNAPAFDDSYFFSKVLTRWGRSWSTVHTSRESVFQSRDEPERRGRVGGWGSDIEVVVREGMMGLREAGEVKQKVLAGSRAVWFFFQSIGDWSVGLVHKSTGAMCAPAPCGSPAGAGTATRRGPTRAPGRGTARRERR